jgi:epoxide hydrolase-like predicted phosphatase
MHNYQEESKIPVVALIGLPNAGKSSLINRLCEKKVAIVAKEAHTTRDLNNGEVEWVGHYFRLVDTGGLVPDPQDQIQKEVQIKSWGAIAQADLLVWVIDRKQNIDTISDSIIKKIWQTGKPFIIAINKVDDPNHDKSIAEYAKLGGNGFINICCNNGYNLGELCDEIIILLDQKGHHTAKAPELFELKKEKPKVDQRLKKVEKTKDGTYVIRQNDGLFESFNEEAQFKLENDVDTLVFDFYNVVFEDGIDKTLEILGKDYKLNLEQKKLIRKAYLELDAASTEHEFSQELVAKVIEITKKKINFEKYSQLWDSLVKENDYVCDFIKHQKSLGKNIVYITNIGSSYESRKNSSIYKYFDGGVASCEVGVRKPDPKIFRLLLEKYDLKANKCVFIDDKQANVEAAKLLGFKTIQFDPETTDLDRELKILENKNPLPPKILFLGKPNVGKSSLFNSMVGKQIQIVTDIAGTTLSVNEMELSRKVRLEREIPVRKLENDLVEFDGEGELELED